MINIINVMNYDLLIFNLLYINYVIDITYINMNINVNIISYCIMLYIIVSIFQKMIEECKEVQLICSCCYYQYYYDDDYY